MQSISHMNNLLSQLYLSDLHRDNFFDTPEVFLEYYNDLSTEDKSDFSELEKDKITEFASGLKNKLCDRISIYYDPLFERYPHEMQSLFSDFYLNRKPGVNESTVSYAIALGEYLRMKLFNVTPNCLLDVVKYLLQKNQAKNLDLPAMKFTSKRYSLKSKPCLAPNVIIESYKYDVIRLISDLSLIDSSPDDKECYLIMQSTDKNLIIHDLSTLAFNFLENCFGYYSLEQLIEKLQYKFKVDNSATKELVDYFIPELIIKNQIYMR